MTWTHIAVALMVLGVACELTGVGLGWRELKARGDALKAFKAAQTPIRASIRAASSVDAALSVASGPQTELQRIERLEARLDAFQSEVARRQRESEERMSEAIARRVSDSEQGLSARISVLRDLVVGTTDGGRQARLALVLLVVGLILSTLGNFASLAK